ncbi:MAG: hypothetical protein JSS49_20450 [Planctomycetes bacterium]|nr:hypothetical protein [Planctomycetota bacterium]
MGSLLEINDTLQITTAEGFPDHLFNLERHRRQPITLDEVKDMVFEFKGKTGPRFFHLDPVRVYWYHNINGRWLAWGQIVIQEQSITRNPQATVHDGAINISDPKQWVTNGKYKILKIYDPQYQEQFTRKDLPDSLSYFHD